VQEERVARAKRKVLYEKWLEAQPYDDEEVATA